MTSFPTDARGWLERLVAFDTTSRNSNLELINYVRDYFVKVIGVDPEKHILTVYNQDCTKANMLVTVMPRSGDAGTDIRAGRVNINGGIILSGHTDVVPVDGQKWESDPFKLTERNGLLYGRGTCDMKGFLAVALALAKELRPDAIEGDSSSLSATASAFAQRKKPVHFCFSYDEEIGCQGIPSLIQRLQTLYQNNSNNNGMPDGNAATDTSFHADACLIGEPTEMKVFTGNKGFQEWYVSVYGRAIHSSLALMGTSSNAIEHASSIIAYVRKLGQEVRENKDNCFRYNEKDNAYQCPFSPICTGIVSGGNAVNTVPAQCDFTFSVRITDSSLARRIEERVRQHIDTEVLPEMLEEHRGAGAQVKTSEELVSMRTGTAYPPFSADEDAPLTQKARELRQDTHVHKMGGGTEAGFFQDILKIPTVIVGPGGVDEAHQPNEYVSVEQLHLSLEFTREMIQLYTS